MRPGESVTAMVPEDARFTVSASLTRMVVHAARQSGLDGGRLLDLARVDRGLLEDRDGNIPCWAFTKLWCLAVAERPDFGLVVADLVDASSLGILGFSASHATTFADSIERAVRFRQLVSTGTVIRFERIDEGGVVTVGPLTPGERWPAGFAEMTLGAFATLGRKWTSRADPPLWTRFKHPRPDHHDAYRRIFGDTVRFGHSENQIALPRALIEARLTDATPELGRYLDREALSALRGVEVVPLVTRVRRWVADVLSNGAPRLALAARTFGMSSRTLQRRLAEAGTSYEQLVDEERKRIALEMLLEARTSVFDAATLAGYGDGSAFRDAVYRWTGVSPFELKRRSRVPATPPPRCG